MLDVRQHPLNQAVTSKSDYSDAILSMNLTYRIKATLDRDDNSQFKSDLAKANEWASKAMQVRMKIQEAQQRHEATTA